jgi:hypothetical protein
MIFKEVQTLANFLFLINEHVHLTKGKGLEWHVYFLTNRVDYNGIFD